MKISTTRFGDINVDETRVIQMEGGILGFEHLEKYVLLTQDEKTPFCWFQSVEDGSVAFVVINSLMVKPDYEPVVSDDQVRLLEIASPEDAVLFSVVTIHSDPFTVTANLRAPIVINTKRILAKQIILVDSNYSIQHPIMENEAVLEGKKKAETIPLALAL